MKLHTIATPKNARFRFVRDDSCHWYAIPADKQADFEKWVESFDTGGEEWVRDELEDFNQYRLSMHPSSYSFTDLKETE
jgi:hypothetical protein